MKIIKYGTITFNKEGIPCLSDFHVDAEGITVSAESKEKAEEAVLKEVIRHLFKDILDEKPKKKILKKREVININEITDNKQRRWMRWLGFLITPAFIVDNLGRLIYNITVFITGEPVPYAGWNLPKVTKTTEIDNN